VSLRCTLALLTTCLAATFASAATLRGVVENGTTGKPAAGDNVVLISLANGMTEAGRTQTDARGRFGFTVTDNGAPLLIRVLHQEVAYHELAKPGAGTIRVRVFEAAPQLDHISVSGDAQRFQADADTLQVSEVITVRNSSDPPRTLINDRTLEIQLPAEAKIDSGLVQPAGGQRLKLMPIPDQQGRYHFRYPLRPGETRFGIVYRLPYSGEAMIEPKILYPVERFVVMLPKSMRFEARAAGVFQPTITKADANVHMTAAMKPGETPAFRVSGKGVLQELQQPEKQTASGQALRPGGGLGTPIQLPDPLHGYRWRILSGLALMMAAGAVHVTRRPAAPRFRTMKPYAAQPIPAASRTRSRKFAQARRVAR
jgi:hypothetical protein